MIILSIKLSGLYYEMKILKKCYPETFQEDFILKLKHAPRQKVQQ